MNQLQIFTNPAFGQVRTTEEGGKVLFCASDIAKALGYSNIRDAIIRHCKGVVKHDGVSYTTNQHGKETAQVTEMNYIPEGDVYRLIIRSRLPSAEKFERWVFDEVLPAIRKTGGYGQFDIASVIKQTAVAVVGEVMKQLLPLFQQMAVPVPVQTTATPTTNHKLYNMPTSKCKLDTFPQELRMAVDERMEEMKESCELNFSEIARFCTLHGFPISSPSVKRYYNYRF